MAKSHYLKLQTAGGMDREGSVYKVAVENAVLRSRNGGGIIIRAEGMSWVLFFQIVQAIPSAISATWNGPVRGMTALHVAADNLRPEYCRLLLARGADPNAADSVTGNTPLHVTVRDRSNFLAIYPLKSGLTPKLNRDDEVSALEREVVEALIRGGASMDVENRSGETALAYAVSLGRCSIVRFMLNTAKGTRIRGWVESGTDFVVANAEGSLLDLALRLQKYEVVEELCGLGFRFTTDVTRLPLRWGKRRFPRRIDDLLTPLGL